METRVSNSSDRDVKYQIFVSSTFKDLSEQRKIVIRTILQTGHMPIAIDNFSPREERDREVIDKSIRNCDFCILIIGYSYGECVDHECKSYTEYEYDKAVEFKKPILAFILNEKEIKDNFEGTKNLDKLICFITKVKAGSLPSYWFLNDLPDFTGKVAIAIKDECDSLKITKRDSGWVPAKSHEDRELVGLAMNNEFYLETVKRLNSFEKLDNRCGIDIEEKKVVANHFIKIFFDDIIKNNTNLFFESGSSVAHVAKLVGRRLKTKISIDKEGKPNLDVITNNILAYLELWLNNRIPCSFWPWGCPEEPYGASYGPISGYGIEENIDEPRPKYDLSPLDAKAKESIENLSKLLYGPSFINNQKKPLLMCGAISGIQFTEKHNLVFQEGHLKNTEVESEINKCFGFHVGSYRNKIFKRYMYSTNNPLVVFLDYAKVNCPIIVDKCHFVFDNEYTWANFLANYPLAFIIGSHQSNMKDIIETFKDQLGFNIDIYSKTQYVTSIFAYSNNFPINT